MQTTDKSGIICDYCGLCSTNDFAYYSFDFRAIHVMSGRVPSLDIIHNARITSSYDICEGCFASLSQTIIENFKKIQATRRLGTCELTGKIFAGTYDYYYGVVTKVNVRMTGQPNICVGCQKQSFDTQKACSCGSVSFVRPASINTITRFLEFNSCEEAFQTFRQKAEAVRTRPTQWTTNS